MTGVDAPASLERIDKLLRRQFDTDRTATDTIDSLLDIRLELMRKRDAESR